MPYRIYVATLALGALLGAMPAYGQNTVTLRATTGDSGGLSMTVDGNPNPLRLQATWRSFGSSPNVLPFPICSQRPLVSCLRLPTLSYLDSELGLLRKDFDALRVQVIDTFKTPGTPDGSQLTLQQQIDALRLEVANLRAELQAVRDSK